MTTLLAVAAWMATMFVVLAWNYMAHLNDPPDDGDSLDRR
jgi:hypothetical protein